MKVLLIAPLFENPKYPLYMPSENLGLGYLASTLRLDGTEVEIIDANLFGLPAPQIPNHAKQGGYDLVGISVPFQSVIDESLQIAQLAREAWPKAHITVGGHFPTFRDKAILVASSSIDSVVRGDGEDTLVALCKAIRLKTGFDLITGLTFRDSAGRIVVNIPRPPRESLDALPWPARDTLKSVQQLHHPWPTQICSSRGCYASCTFCDIRSFYGRTWRARDPKPLVDEIQWLHANYGSEVFRFTDDEFIGPKPGKGQHGPTRARNIAKEIIDRGLEIDLMIDARPESVDYELFSYLKEAGVVDCLVGIESGVDRILKLYNKGATVSKNTAAITTLRNLGISLNLGFIMFDPRMTMTELKQNYCFLCDHDVVTIDSLRSWLWPLYGTAVIDQLRDGGLVISETLGDLTYRFADPRVGCIFNFICECAKMSRPLDRMIYRTRCLPPSLRPSLTSIESAMLSLWRSIFASALDDYKACSLLEIEKELDRLLTSVNMLYSKNEEGSGV